MGEKNTFGHPNSNVMKRIKQLGTKIYRTDEGGEISITINKNGRFKFYIQYLLIFV